MSILVVAVLFVPGIVAARALWRRLSRPNPSVRYPGVAAAMTISDFFAIQFLTMFVWAFRLSRGCAGINDFYVETVADAFRWQYLVCSRLAVRWPTSA